MVKSIPGHLLIQKKPKVYSKHSSFNHTVNFIHGDEIIALHDASKEASPMGIITDYDAKLFDKVKDLIESITISNQKVTINGQKVHLDDVSLSEHNLINQMITLGALHEKQIEHLTTEVNEILSTLTPSPSITIQALNDKTNNLITALNLGDYYQEAIYNLIGFGEGLTPSGDDIITGLLAGLLLNKQFDLFNEIKPIILNRLDDENATNIISKNFIRYACEGIFIENILNLHSNLFQNLPIKDILKRIGAMGQSSGRDYLIGLSVGITSGGKKYDS